MSENFKLDTNLFAFVYLVNSKCNQKNMSIFKQFELSNLHRNCFHESPEKCIYILPSKKFCFLNFISHNMINNNLKTNYI